MRGFESGRRLASMGLALGIVAAGVAVQSPASAISPSVFTVSTFEDHSITYPVPGCLQPDGSGCDLREAIALANRSGDVTIRVPAGTYRLSLCGRDGAGNQLDGSQGDLDVTTDMTIVGIGGTAVIDAAGCDRALDVQGSGTPVIVAAKGAIPFPGLDGVASLTLIDVSVINGRPGAAPGGGIRVGRYGTLSMLRGSVANNIAGGGSGGGGGIDSAGQVTLTEVTVGGNRGGQGAATSGDGFGGGIRATRGKVTLVNSAMTSNRADYGGAISTAEGVVVAVKGSSVYGNLGGLGGAMFLFCSSLNLDDSTVSSNEAIGLGDPSRASAVGGALRLAGTTAVIKRSTIAGNATPIGGGAFAVRAGCSGNPIAPGKVFIRSSVVSNSGPAGKANCYLQDAYSAIITSGHNLINDAVGCELGIPVSSGDLLGTTSRTIDPKILPLAFNGGRSLNLLTHALATGSPAVAAATAADCSGTSDERGVPRSLGGVCDIGAYERVTCGAVVVNRVGTAGVDDFTDPRVAPTSGRDGILGLGGDDNLAGRDGADAICGGAGNDTLRGGSADDAIYGGVGNDVMIGGTETDTCDGGPGTDSAATCEVRINVP